MALTADTMGKIEALFKKMDLDGDGKLTKSEAQQHFKKFSKIAADAMFKEVRALCRPVCPNTGSSARVRLAGGRQ